MFDLRLGISISSVASRMSMELMELLARSSIKTFELNATMFCEDYDGALREAFRRILAESGKRVISYHIPFSPVDDVSAVDEATRLRALSRFRALLKEAVFFQAELLVLHPSTEPVVQNRRAEHQAQLRKSMQELEGEIKLAKMRLVLENLPRLCMGNTIPEVQSMLCGMSATCGACLDVNHLMNQYQQLPHLVRQLGQQLYTLHISDYDGIDEKHWLPRQGVIDWKEFVKALADIKYQGPFNYEVKINQDLDLAGRIAEIESNFAWIKTL